ncbi:MAG: Abi family protein [Bacteroidales bacterium]|nr:Abi family protein [Bacteroidales bacterium]
MKINYSKPCTLPQDLIPLLKGRGLTIADEPKAVDYLTNIGYFRLSAYCYPLLKDPKCDHIYKPNATFDLVMNMYRFDRKLRILLFNEIEKIEVAIRSAMNNWVSDGLNDVFWMTDPKHFDSPKIFNKRLATIQTELDRTNEDFIIHFQNKYANPYPPAWMISEIVPFGTLCGLFNNLKYKSIQKKVAGHFGLSAPVFSSWIVSLVNLRNLCGHHNRTWNKENPLVPAPLKSPAFSWIDETSTDPRRIYFRICIIKYMLSTVSPNNTFTQKLKNLLVEYPTINIKAMGFPTNWQNEPLWK